jgi:hypothetical protein
MKVASLTLAGSLFALLAIAGCSKSDPAGAGAKGANLDGSKYLLGSEPEGGADVIAVRESAQNDDQVTIVGRIGGSADPWVEGMAAFSIVDPSLKACSDIEGDACPKPWDYCCELDKLKTATALVKVVDESGEVVAADARELLNVKELQTVVVQGKAQRDDEGNLTVLATGIHVRK